MKDEHFQVFDFRGSTTFLNLYSGLASHCEDFILRMLSDDRFFRGAAELRVCMEEERRFVDGLPTWYWDYAATFVTAGPGITAWELKHSEFQCMHTGPAYLEELAYGPTKRLH